MNKLALIAVSILFVIGTASLIYGTTCTYEYSPPWAKCADDSSCATFKDPIASQCYDTGVATGERYKDSWEQEDTLVTVYSGGWCNDGENCLGGTPFSQSTETLTHHECEKCSPT
jgi:hypothetical protein